MKIKTAFAILLIALATTSAPVRAGSAREISCGGLQFSYGMSIGTTGRIGNTQHASGVMALAAVTTSDLHARAWMVWDEMAHPWLAVAQNTPGDLKQLWGATKPNFAGPGVQVRWTYLVNPLPAKYRLTDCAEALPYAK